MISKESYPLLVMILLLFSSCSNRDHDNPFDPKNPSTGGQPIELKAIPAPLFVTLHWEVPVMDDLEPARLLMRVIGSSTIVVRDGIMGDGSCRHYCDPSESEQAYWIETPVQGWSGLHRSDTSVVISSRGECWVASGYDRVGLFSPYSMSFLPAICLGTFLLDTASSGDSLWAIGSPAGYVHCVIRMDGAPVLIEEMSTGLSLSSFSLSRDHRLLLAHSDGLTWLNPAEYRTSPWQVTLPAMPILVRLSPEGDAAWIWDRDGELLYVPVDSLAPTRQWSIGPLYDMEPSHGGFCWAATASGVIRVNREESSMREVEIPARIVSVVDSTSCWASVPEERHVVLVHADGTMGACYEGFSASALDYSKKDAVLWVSTIDARLLKFLNDGRVAANTSLDEAAWTLNAL